MAQSNEQKLLQEMMNLLCKDMTKRLKEGESVVTKNGELVNIDCRPATLSVIRQFLKDNDISAIPRDGNALGELINNLPTSFGDDEDEDEDERLQNVH